MESKTAIIVALLLSTTASSSLLAQVVVRGMPSCGEWAKPDPNDVLTTVAFQRWLVGYMSGMAIASKKDILSGTDNASLFLWMDNWCRANPLKDVAMGANELYFELVKQKRL
jgi:hypothetical protein